MQKRKLLIAEGSEELRTALADIFSGSCQVRCCADGDAARQELLRFRPDVLVLDLMLPGFDGISLLQWALEQDIRPIVLATTRFCSDYVADTLQSLGVGYLMLKPCSLSALAARVADLNQKIHASAEKAPDPETRVSSLLLTLGIPPKLRGYAYLCHAVTLYQADPLQSVTKVLYPEVAKRCGCAAMHVERSIRNAIDTGWKRRDDHVWKLYFPPDGTGQIARPTNGDFISRLADSLGAKTADLGDSTEMIQKSR